MKQFLKFVIASFIVIFALSFDVVQAEEVSLAGGTETTPVAISNNNVTVLTGGYYIVQQNIEFSHTLKLRGNTTITIAENARLQFGKDGHTYYSYFNKLGERVPYAIDGYDFAGDAVYSLTIDGKGSLWAGISYYENTQHVDEDVVIRVGSYTQKGGTVHIDGTKYNATDKTRTGVKGIYASNVTVSGGSLETRGLTSAGNIDISDATVSTLTGSHFDLGISSLIGGNITISRATINILRLETKGAIVIQNGSTLNNYDIGRSASAPSSVTITNSVVQCSGSVIGNEVTINGGQVTSQYGIRALTGNITINGGQVTSNTQVSLGGMGIEAANGSIILKSSEASDFIKFSKLSAKVLTIEENRTYTDGTNYYDNTKTANVLALTDTTLRPANISILTGGTEEAPAALNNIRVDTLNGGWYIVEEDITFTHKLTLLGDTTIILSGDMNVGSSGKIINGETDEAGNAVYSDNYSLCIEGTGSFNVYCGNYAVYVKDYVQNGGNVNLQGKYGVSANNVTINGGKITASGSTTDISGLQSLNINGGQVTATNKGISSNVSAVIGYTNADDFINISKIDNRGTAAVKEGCTFTDGTNNYESSTDSTTLFALQNVTLRPKNVHTITITAGEHITVETDGERGFENATVTLLVSPDNGYAVSSVKYNNTEITPENGVYSFLMPTEDVTITAEATIITYTITYDLDGGALADGKSNPESYTVETALFALNAPTKQGYRFVGWIGTGILSDTPAEYVSIKNGSTGDREYTAVWEYEFARYGETESYKPDGTEEKPYIISTVGGWNFLVQQAGNRGQWQKYTGQFFRLDANLTLSTSLPIGSTFEGIFDGNGHKLTFDISGSGSTAPFYSVNGGTIKNLTVDGTIKATSSGAAGLIAQSKGATTIENCQFVGKLLAIGNNIDWVDYCGGFVGNNTGTLTITNSLYAPAAIETGETEAKADHSATFALNGTNGTSTITNSYYTRTLGEVQGTLAHTVSAGEGITMTLDDTSTTGLLYDGAIYAGQDETVILNVTAPNGYVLGNVTASAGTLTPTDGKYSLTMPESDVVITAASEPATYTVTYDLNGGSLPENSSNPESYTVASEAITLNNPVRAGYNFAGWTGTDLNEATVNVTINQGSTGNRSYTANWTANTYTVQFNANNGTGDEMEAQSFTYGGITLLSL